MLEATINKINSLNEKYSEIEEAISYRDTSLNKIQYDLLCSVGGVWNLNKQSGDFWFNDKMNYSDGIVIDVVNELNSLDEINDITTENILLTIKDKMKLVDSEILDNFKNNNDISKEDLLKYLPLLSAHQEVYAHNATISRWGYTVHIDISTLSDVLSECDLIQQFINNDINKDTLCKMLSNGDNINSPIDGNKLMEYGWKSFEYGLYEESEFIFRTLFNFGMYVSDVVNSDVTNETTFSANDLNIISTLSRCQDLPRYMLSVGIGLGKVLVNKESVLEAKYVYEYTMKLIPETINDTFGYITYWLGLNRLMEVCLELYKISDEDEKKLLKTKIIDMFVFMRLNKEPNNTGESVVETLLIIYMMLNTIYE